MFLWQQLSRSCLATIFGWFLSQVFFFPFKYIHLFLRLIKNFYIHRVVNEPLESIASDLGFNGNTLEEGKIHYIVPESFLQYWF